MNSLPIIVSDDEQIIKTTRQKKRVRNISGSDSEDEFTAPRTQKKRSMLENPKQGKIRVHKVEIVKTARPSASVELSAAAAPSPPPSPGISAPAATPSGLAAASYTELMDEMNDYLVFTPTRAVTPDAELGEYEQDAQPLVDPDEAELMGNHKVFSEFPCFDVLCGTATVGSGFALQPYYSTKDRNNRMLKCSYAVIDKYSRKFLSVGVNPHKGFKPVVCLSFDAASVQINNFEAVLRHLRFVKRRLVNTLGRNDRMIMSCDTMQSTLAPGKRLRLSVHKVNLKLLKPHEYIILSEAEIDCIIDSEEFIAAKLNVLKQLGENLENKYLQLLQNCVVGMIQQSLNEPTLKENLRKEIFSVKDNFLNECWWEMYIYYSFKIMFDLDNVNRHIRKTDKLVVNAE